MRCLREIRGPSALLWMLLAAAPLLARGHIGEFEFFGHKGIDVAKVRETLPVHSGDIYSGRMKGLVQRQ
jgi:hypothetical protein